MGKQNIYIFLIIILIFNAIGCSMLHKDSNVLIVDDYNGIDLENINHYEIHVNFNPKDKSYLAKQTTLYINNTKKVLDKVYFHIYPNVFKSVETAPVLFSSSTISKEDYSPGGMKISRIMVDNREVDFKTQGIGGVILKIELPNSLKPNSKAIIDFEYHIRLPSNIDRFGYGEDVFNFGNWYPIACVYDEDGWNLEPYYSIGDPFYSDIANYDVIITVPRDMVIASSGSIISEKTGFKRKTYTIKGKLIRDFAWVASTDFSIEEIDVGKTTIKLYTLEDKPEIIKFALETGEDSMNIFNRIFGEYPYSTYSIAMTEFPTGMEYPGIVFIGRGYFNSHLKNRLEQIIVHETAHQWWYGVVGNNQINEAWLDESLTSYSEVIYMIEKYGKAQGMDYYDYFYQENYEHGKAFLPDNIIVKKPLNEFKSWNDYGLLVYVRGAMFLNEIKEDFGIDKLYRILSKYYTKYRFYNANTEGFIEICQDVTNVSFEDRVNRWLYAVEQLTAKGLDTIIPL